jgi:hypothetical protein
MDFIIDGNAYLNVAINVTKNICFRDKTVGAKYYVNDIFNEGKHILKEQVKLEFRNFCINYLNSLIAPVSSKIHRVHLVFDSSSWRKEYINDFFENEDFKTDSAPEKFKYKGNRKKDDHIYLFFDYFQNEISKKLIDLCGVNYYRIRGTEGDDIIAYLCETIDTDALIYTVDGDIRQLTHSEKNNVIIIYPKQTSGHKKLCISDCLNPSSAVDEVDNFFSLDDSHIVSNPINYIVTTLKNKDYVEYKIDTVYEVFNKIFRGDGKDNIPKMDKMTPSKSERLIGEIRDQYGKESIKLLDLSDSKFIDFVIQKISILNKVNDIDKLTEIRKHFLFNSKIIRLSSSLFPEKVLDSLKEINPSEFKKFNFKKLINIKNNPSII